MNSEQFTLTLPNFFSQHSHYADIMKLSWKPTQRLSDLPKGTQLGVETGEQQALPLPLPTTLGV